MKIAILTGTHRKNSAYKTMNALNSRGQVTCELVHYDDVMITIDENQESCTFYHDAEPRDIDEFDLIYIHGAGGEELRPLVASVAEIKGIPFLNSENLNTQYICKASQYLKFKRAGLPIPRTIVGYPSVLRKAFETEAPGAWIIKLAAGSNGKDNFLINAENDIDSCDNKSLYVMQPFIANDFDYRIIVGGDKVLLAYKRSRDKSRTHVNNVHQGGTREFTGNPLPKRIESIAIKASNAVNREISGVDILISADNKPYLLESNFNYGLPKIEDIPASYFDSLQEYLIAYAKDGHRPQKGA